MQIFISDPITQTIIFGVLLGLVFLFTFRTKRHYTSLSLTQELKGFAILAVVLSHIGYFLSSNQQFLFPFSILAGVGVNIFFYLSGYGLTLSQLKRSESVLQFYRRRLLKLFVPLWIVLTILFTVAYFGLGMVYGKLYVFSAYLGIFTKADLYADINSPLWYITLLLFFYLLFPIVFSKKWPWLTAAVLYGAVWLLVTSNLPALWGVVGLYQVHTLAFPLGVLMAWLLPKITPHVTRLVALYKKYESYAYPIVLIGLLSGIWYLAIHSNVGAVAYLEEDTSMVTMGLIIVLFALKKRESKLLSLIGLYSYEIYLFHWPLLYHYDIVYKFLPAGMATVLYIGIFIVLAKALQGASKHVARWLDY